jgi:hypothetical protein
MEDVITKAETNIYSLTEIGEVDNEYLLTEGIDFSRLESEALENKAKIEKVITPYLEDNGHGSF